MKRMQLLAGCVLLWGSHLLAENTPLSPVDVLKISAAPPVIDGYLDEAIWQETAPVRDFIQRYPKDGTPASEPTAVYLLYSATDLYIGVRCYDSRPQKMVATVMQRDNFDLLQNEQFVVAIDSYNDGSNGFWFSTNPLGMRADCQFINEGETWICEWDGIWECRARMDSLGWTAEMRIPFATLRFEKKDQNIMGINLFRRIIRTNEEVFSPHIPLQYPHGTADVSIARKFVFRGIAGGNHLYVQPYVLAGHQQTGGRSDGGTTKREFGGEIRHDLSENITANLTYNTDFAQVELDDRQINLTRFNLFFPEKRDFFLESAGVFAFGLPQMVEVFFSRRIGLTQDGSGRSGAVPILAGGKLTGKLGKIDLGMMDVQTRSAGSLPGQNFAVGRLKYRVLPRSYVGVIGTQRHSGRRFDNRALGLDANILVSNDVGFSGFAATTFAPGGETKRLKASAANLTVFKRGERAAFQVSLTGIGKQFDPQVGYLQRRDVRILSGNARVPVYVHSRRVRRLVPAVMVNYIENYAGQLENASHQVSVQTELQSNDVIYGFITRDVEYVPFDFSIFKQVRVPAGNYTHYSGGLKFESKPGRRISTELGVKGGGVYGGRQATLLAALQWKVSRHLTLFQRYETGRHDIAGQAFRTAIAQSRIHFALNTRFFINTLIQYDNESDELGLNIRLNQQFSEGRELFLVYNDIFAAGERRFPGTSFRSKTRSLILKFNYLFNL